MASGDDRDDRTRPSSGGSRPPSSETIADPRRGSSGSGRSGAETVADRSSGGARQTGNETIASTPSAQHRRRPDAGRESAGGETVIDSSSGRGAAGRASAGRGSGGRGTGGRGDTVIGTPGGTPAAGEIRTFADGRYEVVEIIASGGFGTVYKAYDHNFDRHVAVKVIKTDDIAEEDLELFLRLFHGEAQAAGRLDHPGIVMVYDHDPYAQEPFLVMQLIEGGTLSDLLDKRKKLDWKETVKLGVEVAEALHYAHQNGVEAHRDIKPKNIFCAPDRYKVGDFGIARRTKQQSTGLTRSSFIAAGTQGYMAPEQVASPRDVGPATDVFALGVVLYLALTGTVPYRGVSLGFDPEEDPESAKRIVRAAFEQPPTPLRQAAPGVPAAVARAIEKALQFEPQKRYRSCADFAEALRQAGLAAEGKKAKSGGLLWKAIAAAAVLLMLGGGFLLRERIGEMLFPNDLTRAEKAAAAAGAAEHAPDLWQQALAEKEKAAGEGDDDSRADYERIAMRKFDEARRVAWQNRLEAAKTAVADVEAKALAVLAEDLAKAKFEAAREALRAAKEHEASGDEARLGPAVESYEAAADDFEAAHAQARDAGRDDLGGQLAGLRARWGEMSTLAGAIDSLKSAADQVAAGLDAVGRAIESEDFRLARESIDNVEVAIAAIEVKLRDIKNELAVVRVAAEKQKEAALAAGAEARDEGAPAAAADEQLGAADDLFEKAESLADYSAAKDAYTAAASAYAAAVVDWHRPFESKAAAARAAADGVRQRAVASPDASSPEIAELVSAGDGLISEASAAFENRRYRTAAARYDAAAASFAEAEKAVAKLDLIRAADRSIADATDARTSAEEAGADTALASRDDFAKGAALLASAEKGRTGEPTKAAADAEQAATLFAKATASAANYRAERANADLAIVRASTARQAAVEAGAAEAAYSREDFEKAAAIFSAAEKVAEAEPKKAVASAEEAATLFAKAAESAAKYRADRTQAETALKEAGDALEKARAQHAAELAGTKKRFEEAEKSLAQDRKVAATDPRQAAEQAKLRKADFERLADDAGREIASLSDDAKRARADAVAKQTAAAKAEGDKYAGGPWTQGAKLLGEGDAIAEADWKSSLARIDKFEKARDAFAEAKTVLDAPAMTASPNPGAITVKAGEQKSFSVSAGRGIQPSVKWTLGGSPVSSAAGYTFAAKFDDPETSRPLRAEARDKYGREQTFSWTVTVNTANAAPEIARLSASPDKPAKGQTITVEGTVRDADAARGDSVSCRWLVGGSEVSKGAPQSGSCRYSFKGTSYGKHQVELVAVDSKAKEMRRALTVTIEPPEPAVLVRAWLRNYCRDLESTFERTNRSKMKCSWTGEKISGSLPDVTVQFVRIDESDTLGRKELPKECRLVCEDDCKERACRNL